MDNLPPELGGGNVEDPSARTRVVKNKYNLACQACADAKRKCDGDRPCKRCRKLGIACVDRVRKPRGGARPRRSGEGGMHHLQSRKRKLSGKDHHADMAALLAGELNVLPKRRLQDMNLSDLAAFGGAGLAGFPANMDLSSLPLPMHGAGMDLVAGLPQMGLLPFSMGGAGGLSMGLGVSTSGSMSLSTSAAMSAASLGHGLHGGVGAFPMSSAAGLPGLMAPGIGGVSGGYNAWPGSAGLTEGFASSMAGISTADTAALQSFLGGHAGVSGGLTPVATTVAQTAAGSSESGNGGVATSAGVATATTTAAAGGAGGDKAAQGGDNLMNILAEVASLSPRDKQAAAAAAAAEGAQDEDADDEEAA